MVKQHVAVSIALMLGVWFDVPVICAQSFYVATNGHDANIGSEHSPWRTIQKAANDATPGSTVYVKAGSYNEHIDINVSGTDSSHYITFRPFRNDEVTIDGTNTRGRDIIRIDNRKFIRIIGFTVKNKVTHFGAGINIEGAGNDFVIMNNKISNITGSGGRGISVYGTASQPIRAVLIDGNEVFDSTPSPSESITMSGYVQDFTISNNVVHDVNNIGIDVTGGFDANPDPDLNYVRRGRIVGNTTYNCGTGNWAAGIYVDGASHITVERNISYQNDIGISLNCEVMASRVSRGIAEYDTIRNNLVFRNRRRGISIGSDEWPGRTGIVRFSRVTGNTCFMNNTVNNEGEILVDYALDCVIENNIFFGNTRKLLLLTHYDVVSNNVHLDYNLWFAPGGGGGALFRLKGRGSYRTFDAYRAALPELDRHSLFGDPVFLNMSEPVPDLHLSAGSPARESGNPSYGAGAGEVDFDGRPRIGDGRVDIGAYEYVGSRGMNNETGKEQK